MKSNEDIKGRDLLKRYEYLLWYIAFITTLSFVVKLVVG